MILHTGVCSNEDGQAAAVCSKTVCLISKDTNRMMFASGEGAFGRAGLDSHDAPRPEVRLGLREVVCSLKITDLKHI